MTATTNSPREYGRVFTGPGGSFSFLWQVVVGFLPKSDQALRVLDVGCGNGHWAGELASLGHDVMGVDGSAARIENATRSVPQARFRCAEIGPTLLADLREDPFDVVVSTEVVEHLYDPAAWAEACFHALRPGGRLICSTPYHGYLKNLAIAVTNGWDHHHHTLRSGGHIKFFSERTLRALLVKAGFETPTFRGAGRLPYLWQSMVMAADTPSADRPIGS